MRELKPVAFETAFIVGLYSLHGFCVRGDLSLRIAFVKREAEGQGTEFGVILFLLVLVDDLFLSGKSEVSLGLVVTAMAVEMPL